MTVNGILVGTDDGLLQVVPGEQPQRALEGLPVTSLDHREGISLAGVPGSGVWVQLSERRRRLARGGGPGWQRLWEGNARCVRVAPGDDLYIGVEPAALFSVYPGAPGGNELGALRGAVQADRQSRTPSSVQDSYVAGIAFSDRGPEEGMYVAVAGGGVWYAPDSGRGLNFERFERRSEGLDPDLHGLWMHPERPDRLFASTASGLFRSADGGRIWVQSVAGLDRGHARDGVVLPGTPDILLLACARREAGLEGALFRSSDDGLSWARVVLGEEDEWERAPLVTRLWDSEDTVFVAAGERLWGSHDSAASWVLLAEGLPPPRSLAVAL